ncbi:DUF1156 domain-containing protein [Megasphaera stantonii]|uniref:DUF1156 domain-containing protein n=1 Tax=Megasphaera stantonii TaxID=2144175 RepID=A0A346B1F5_9FIRM|nr:DUF1156 domain-containing protein [Megasphaera stantonii]AXL21948.1 DUF1156 domain-containing protein [Megasphaera stantonii]
MEYEEKLIEGNFPCQQVGAETKRERDTGTAPPTHRLHVWWARRPLTPSRAAILGSILPASTDTEMFLKELGIRKYQLHLNGTTVDIPKAFIEENGSSLKWSRELERIFTNDNKIRGQLSEALDSLFSVNPEFRHVEAIEKLQERAQCIDISEIDKLQTFKAIEVAADPAWFNEVLNIFSASGIRLPNLYGYDRAYTNCAIKYYPNYTVLDPTAGGGSIPFEAMRLGCKVIANDLNPVATGIEYASLKYPVVLKADLISELKSYSEKMIMRVSEKMKEFFQVMREDSIHDLSYLYCREVTCPHCGERAPLLNSFALSKKKDGWMVLPKIEGLPGHKTVRWIPVRLQNGKGPHGENPEEGTVKNGVGRCIHCGQAIESEEIKRQARGESEYGTWADKLYCVVAVRIQPKKDKQGNIMRYASGAHKGEIRTEKVTFFREPTADDFAALKRAEQALKDNWSHWEDMDLIPTEKIPEGHKTVELLKVGVTHWCDMFTPRQLVGHVTAMETLHDMMPEIWNHEGTEKGNAIIHYLQYMIDKCIDYNSRQTRWITQRGSVSGTFSRHDFSLKWTFGELIYTGPNSGLAWGMNQVIDAYAGICKLLKGSQAKPATILHGSAANMAVQDRSVDIICVDPPYYNNVQYAELSDYFYVWEKRTFRAIYPEVFNRRLTNKRDEAVANPVRDGSAANANMAYEQRMSEIFAECRRVLKDNGILTMMFTHKTQAAWETLTRALIENGWIISSSFPVDSEFAAALNQKDLAAAASSIFLACRKRIMTEREPAVWNGFGGTGVRQEIRQAVAKSLQQFSVLHLNAVDEMVASYGSALKVLSENWPVIDGDDEVTPIQAMREASAVVAQYQMTHITNGQLTVNDLHSEAGITLTLLGIYGTEYFPYDDALSLSRSLNIRLETRSGGYSNEEAMIGINDERSGRRQSGDDEEGYYAPLVKKGSKLRLVLPEERNRRRLENPQQEWDIMQGMICKYREGDAPVARAYMQKYAAGKEAILLAMLKVWAENCGKEALRKEAQRMIFDLK